MTINKRINAVSELGNRLEDWLNSFSDVAENPLHSVVQKAFHHNGWFDEAQVIQALWEVRNWMDKSKLENWVSPYGLDQISSPKTIGVIMAGNIPLVGFHDYLSVLISGHQLLAKLSSKDKILLDFLHKELAKIEPEMGKQVEFTESRFSNIDAVIATGSNNSSRYFEYYFANKPHIIRKNRTSVAILSGMESKEALHRLGMDIFRYYGLGCRNVTKIYVPKGFEVSWFYEGIIDHFEVINNHKYQNNYDYHKSLFLLNQEPIWDNNFLILKPETALSSPVGTLYYHEYEKQEEIEADLELNRDNIQCIVGEGFINFGDAQSPQLHDYSDNIDVLSFLEKV